jgi:hypothetical protein
MATRFAPAFAAAALWCGAAVAQGGSAPDAGAVCRGFCDVDAQQCRKDADLQVDREHHLLLPVGPTGGGPSGSYDFSAEKRELAGRREDDERSKGSRACGDARQACRQKCMPSPAASAPSGPG